MCWGSQLSLEINREKDSVMESVMVLLVIRRNSTVIVCNFCV